MNPERPLSDWCPHLYVVGDTRCRLCLSDLEDQRGETLTDVNLPDDGVDWDGADTPESAAAWSPEDYPATKTAPVSYPDNGPLQEAPISINFKVTGEPQITVRGFHASDITTILNDLTENGVWANIAAAQADLRAMGQIGAAMGPVSPVAPQAPVQAPQMGFPQGPQTPPPFGPNVSVPSAPGYVGPPSPQYGQPPQQNWGGNGGSNGNGRAEPKPQPPGWMRINARTGPGFDAWKNMREANKDFFKGKVQWGGKSDYWIEPSIAQWLAGQGYAVTP